MLSECYRFPYLNKKIEEINDHLMNLDVIDEDLFNKVMDCENLIIEIESSMMPLIPELDKLYKDIKMNKPLIHSQIINDNEYRTIMDFYLFVKKKYGSLAEAARGIFDLDFIWNYLPTVLQKYILKRIKLLYAADIAEIIDFSDEAKSINRVTNPFILSNMLDTFIFE